MAFSHFCKCVTIGVTGICLVTLAATVGWIGVPLIVRSKIADILALKKNTETWERWEKLPVPIRYNFYIFNVSNPDEVIQGELPKVTEVGPYVYKEKRIKNIQSVDKEKGTITYDHKIVFEFDQEASRNLKDTDVLVVHNIPAMLFSLIITNLKNINAIIGLYKTAITKIWPTSNPLFVETKVKDLLFDGLPIFCNHTASLNTLDVKILCEAFKILSPKTVRIAENGIHNFAIFNYKNNTSDGIYEIDDGTKDIRNVGQIRSWNGLTKLKHWRGESCNQIVGTDTTIFRPYLEEDKIEELYIYHTDICRSLKLIYEKDTEYKNVKGRRYVAGKDILAGVLENKDNYCFCPQTVKKVTHYGGCLKQGALELTSCQGVPIVVTHPHFLDAHPDYQKKVIGLNPDKEKHGIFLDLEPNTGYPLRGASRVQLNVHLKKIQEIPLLRNLTDSLLPIAWLEETVELTDDLIDVLNQQLLNILKIVEIAKWAGIGAGICLFVVSLFYYFLKVKKSEKTKNNLLKIK